MPAYLGPAVFGAAMLFAHSFAEAISHHFYAAVEALKGESFRATLAGREFYPTAIEDHSSLLAPGPNDVASDQAVVGAASMYNPYRLKNQEGGTQTASGEPYDPSGWTAAIQIDLREQFGGVRHGDAYRPSFALVERGDKRAIIKINDVGSLKPGRVIDLNEQAMRFFDPDLQAGLIDNVRVVPLLGDNWMPGPIGNNG